MAPSTRSQLPARRLEGKRAIVTGAGTPADAATDSIGKAIALVLAREGARVALVDISLQRAERTLQAILEEGGVAFALQGDVVSESDCARVVEEARKEMSGLDVLVNNVGIAQDPGRLEKFDVAVWDHVFDTNLRGALCMARCALPHLIASGGGAIINIASTAGLRTSGAGAAYGPSKAALISLSRELALLYGRDGIRVNAIAPGHIYTPMVADVLNSEQRELRRVVSPLGIEGTAMDVAHAAAFLASPQARYITGVCLPVDGGVTELGALAAHGLITRK